MTLSIMTNCLVSPGSSPFMYMLRNNNMGGVHNSLKNAFDCIGYSDSYNKYQSELEALEKDYQAMSRHGQLLAVRFPQEKMADFVYLTRSGGPKEVYEKNGVSVEDTASIVNLLKESPEDHYEFASVQTWGPCGALNPASGIKISCYQPIDSLLYQAFEKREKALVDTIKHDSLVE